MLRRIVTAIIVLFLAVSSNAFSKTTRNEWLVKIGNKTYTVKDFWNWWENWKVDGSKFPENPTPFIDWMLMFENGTELGLYKYPSYQKKIRQFVKVRSLLLLEGDTLAPARKVTEKEVESYYRKNYIPKFKLDIYFFKNKETAQKARKLIEEGERGEKLAQNLGIKNKMHFERKTDWMRPFEIKNKKQRDLILNAEKGEIIGPVQDGKMWLLIIVSDKTTKENNLQEILKDAKQKLIKIKEAEATAKLLKQLRKKYPVWINKKLLKEINLKNFPEAKKKEVVLKVGNYALTAGGFMKFLKKEVEWEKHSRFGRVNMEIAKRRVIDSIINQTLVGMEALNRHYEQKEPLKPMFEFYCQNRIIKELENRIIRPTIKISQKEIENYYQQHKKQYKLPDKITIRFLQTNDRKLIDKLYKELKDGKDFKKLTITIMGYDNVVTIPYSHLLPESKKIIDNLKEGEVSKPFKIKDTYFMVQVLKLQKNRYKPLSEVKESIKNALYKQKFEEARQAYIRKLYMNLLAKGQEIKVNWDAWNSIVNNYKHRNQYNGTYAFYLFLTSLVIIAGIAYYKGRESEG
ncbi:peptidyl-prolyl cis-trans isomerase [Desulfurobacterium sp.]